MIVAGTARARLAPGTVAAVCLLVLAVLAGCAGATSPDRSDDPPAAGSSVDQPQAGSEEDRADAANVSADAVVGVGELHDLLEKGDVLVVDVRPLYAFDKAAIIGAVSIPAGSQFEVRYEEIPQDRPVYLIDADGSRAAEAREYLIAHGYDPSNVFVVEGGMAAWQAAGYGTREARIRRC